MKTENYLTSPDGRKMAYAEFGQLDGHPVIYCHAAPSAHLVTYPEDGHVSTYINHANEIAQALLA